jgi:hypothetical protein
MPRDYFSGAAEGLFKSLGIFMGFFFGFHRGYYRILKDYLMAYLGWDAY